VLLGATNDHVKARHFLKLDHKRWNENRPVRVLRSGKVRMVPGVKILVGDVVLFEAGDLMIADGILIDGYGVQYDESSVTGESDMLSKTPADATFRAIECHDSLKRLDPFIISGARVQADHGSFLVTGTGVYSSFGRLLMSMNADSFGYAETPLQKKLNMLSECVAKPGLIVATLLFVALLVKFSARLNHNTASGASKGLQFLYILIISVTVVDVAIPSGLPLAQTIALALATRRMLRNNILVRNLRACETLGYTTALCVDETAILNGESIAVTTGAF
jgi:Ca2+-transporting ATPase